VRRADVPTLTVSLPPFDQLTGVRLGMSVSELQGRRPARQEPYVGLTEPIDGGRIEYRFGHDAPGEGRPEGNLSAITARYGLAEKPADTLAAASVSLLASRIGRPVSCERRSVGQTQSVRARWHRDGQALEVVLVHEASPDSGGKPPAYTLLEIVSDDTASHPPKGAITSRVMGDCVAAFRR